MAYLISYIVLVPFGEIALHLPKDAKLWAYPVFFIVGVAIFRYVFVDGWRSLNKNSTRFFVCVIGGYFAGMLIPSIVELFFSSDGSTNSARLAEAMQSHPAVITIPILGVMGVVVEEIVFRYILIGRIAAHTQNRYVPWLLVAVSGTLFGLAHMHAAADFHALPVYCVMGIVLGATYVLSKNNILASTAWHTFNNVMGLLLLSLAR